MSSKSTKPVEELASAVAEEELLLVRAVLPVSRLSRKSVERIAG